jgi:hypothetical protein
VGEVIYRLDADGEIPVTAAVRPAPEGGVVLTLALADVSEAEITGSVPKGASLNDLRCAPDAAAAGHAASPSTCSSLPAPGPYRQGP